jgi:hypothetical protein
MSQLSLERVYVSRYAKDVDYGSPQYQIIAV